ncbi:MAG TPA: peptide ABC transporter substrate-binding protein [Anaerolineae bacterium]|nr:peptide ABC transporter substrate-binding protein [Anaerolineae bacterium]
MRNLRWQLLIAVGGLILVVGLLVGQTPDTDIAAPHPVPGGVHVEALIGKLARLNPILDTYNQVDRDIDRLIYSGLISFNSRGEPMPDLAAEWAVSADATIYTFTLQEDARWHDGEPVTSDDVIYTFSKMQDEDYPGPEDFQTMWQQVNIIRLDEYRVQFQLPEPFAPFLDYLAVGLLPDHLLRGVSAGELIDHPFNLRPIGTGPFAFDRFVVEDDEIVSVSLIAFEDYYDQVPYIERVEFRFFENSLDALDAYLAGEIQGIGQIDPAIFTEVLDSPELNMHTSRLPRISLVFINSKNSEKTYLAEKKFRQALMLSINRQWIIDHALQGQGLIPCGPIMPATWAHSESLESLSFEPDRAARLLDELEWKLTIGATPGTPEYQRTKDDQILSLELIHSNDPTDEIVAEMLKTNWEAIGIRIELKEVNKESLLQDYLEPRDFELVLTEVDLSRSPDPDPYPFWHDSQTETGQNYGGITDRNISIWLEQARVNPDFGRRAELYRNFQHRFQDLVPALLLYYHVYSYAIDAQVQGVTVGPLYDPSDRFRNIVDWYLLTRRSYSSQDLP